MYPIAVVGNDPTARAALLACKKAGFDQLTWAAPSPDHVALPPAYTLSPNLSRIVVALIGQEALSQVSHAPDREQIRFGRSAYLLSELPLGPFSQDRYGAPHVNIEADALLELLAPGLDCSTASSLSAFEQDHGVVIVTQENALGEAAGESSEATHQVWHATTAFEAGMAKANITWLGPNQVIWQFYTPKCAHYVMVTPSQHPWDPQHWHPTLHPALEAAQLDHGFSPVDLQVREYWQEAHRIHAGDTCYNTSPYRRESRALGLEDAWVLSRMLENYEEDIGDGLREYVKYRQPRANKLHRDARTLAEQYNLKQAFRRGLKHTGTAFRTRFMPEIAMQGIDWLYNYDCIKGFR